MNKNLSQTQQLIFGMMSAGQTNMQIAHALNISIKTVASQQSKMYRKSGVRSRNEMLGRGNLTEIQQAAVNLLLDGKTYMQIEDAIAPSSASSAIRGVYRKFGIHSRKELKEYFAQNT